MTQAHIFPVTIYYEDTDITGLVYHPNYFKYFERARSEFFDGEKLRRMQHEDGIGVAVYKAEIMFKKGAVLGDRLEIHSRPEIQGDYRIVFNQQVFRAGQNALLVEAKVELVCISQEKLVRMSQWIVDRVESFKNEQFTA
ncbi:YbgC/FadM family acyl-CoA thioesterase [Anaerolineales bacterium HSG6]|nr:YbgC/FadM family acyl-CoA thioesterase [Anaerolineales bacterium HSG6]MDM8530860.1 YbgC/FadM family acyl-CoA thioesterase [Anaerolineales bacterium HSG25]